MPISMTCSNCDKTLKIPDDVAGKKIRCPACKTVLTVPTAAAEDEAIEEDAPPPKKKSAAIKPEKAAPPKRRDDDDDEVEERDDEDDDDRPRRRKRSRDDEDDDDEDDDIDVRRKKRRKPHRAGTILTLGILSILFACCVPLIAWILAAIALNMAKTDLALMNSKKMDPAGKGNTSVGKICAIVGVVLGIINAAAYVVLKVMGYA